MTKAKLEELRDDVRRLKRGRLNWDEMRDLYITRGGPETFGEWLAEYNRVVHDPGEVVQSTVEDNG